MYHSWIRTNIPAWYLFLIFCVAATGLYIVETTKVQQKYHAFSRQKKAAQLMKECLKSVRAYRLSLGISINSKLDPNRTGIIGEEYTDLTTTLGNLEAKRTATNPAFAALLVRYFTEAGLHAGDVVAIGASGSFPSLILATLSAANVMELKPLLIYSLGASMYGANIPEFTFLQIGGHLRQQGLLPYSPIAISLGGNADRAEGLFDQHSKTTFLRLAKSAEIPFIYEETLSEDIRKRDQLYRTLAGRRGISCFVNIGGSSANYGATSASLKFPNGLVLATSSMPDHPERGLIFEYAGRGIPVIHLLNIRDLAMSRGLPIDPVPFPSIGEGGVYYTTTYHSLLILTVLFTTFFLIFWGRSLWKKSPKRNEEKLF